MVWRYITGMTKLLASLVAGALSLQVGVAAAQTLTLSGQAGQKATITAAELATMPHAHISVKQHGQIRSYDGVILGDILARVGAPRGEAIKGPELATVVRFTARDGYQVVLDLAETDPITRSARVIVADREAGAPLKPEEGPFRLVTEDDLRPARSARQIERIEVVNLATTARAGSVH
jgi:hypothetical protein